MTRQRLPVGVEALVHKAYGDSFEGTNLYWSFQTAPGRTAGTAEAAEVDFAA